MKWGECVSDLIQISNTQIEIKEYKGQRVVTFKDIDMVHERPEGTARQTFNRNRERFVEGEDFFVCETYEAKERFNIVAPNGVALITEQGYLMLVKPFNDEKSWDIQRKLVSSYFKVRQMATDLSPQMQMLYGMLDQMAQTERQAREAKEIAQKAIDTTENIKEAVKPVFDDWSSKIKGKVAHIQKESNKRFDILYGELYKDLEERAGCDLNTRLRNRRLRMQNEGCTKTEINGVTKLTIIEEDKRLREIFSKIVSEYEIRYCA